MRWFVFWTVTVFSNICQRLFTHYIAKQWFLGPGGICPWLDGGKPHINIFFFRDHFFDTETRAKNKKKEKPFKLEGANGVLKGEFTIRQQYGYKINATKMFTSKRLAIELNEKNWDHSTILCDGWNFHPLMYYFALRKHLLT